MSSRDDLPRAIPSMWRALKRAYEAEPRLLAVAFGFSLLSALPDALLALWLKLLADGVLAHDRRLALTAALGLGASATATWFLRVVSDRTQRRFRDRLTIALESHVAQLQASVATIEHHERPDYLNRLSVLRNQVFVLDHMYMSLFSTCGWILRLAVTLALLMSVHPALRSSPSLRCRRCWHRRGGRASSARRRTWGAGQATGAPPVRHGHHRRSWEGGARRRDRRSSCCRPPRGLGQVVRTGRPARRDTAIWNTLAWAIFGAGFVAAVAFVALVVHASPGKVLLVLAAGSRLSAYIGATVGEIGFLRGIWLDGSIRLAWLEDYAAALMRALPTCPFPSGSHAE